MFDHREGFERVFEQARNENCPALYNGNEIMQLDKIAVNGNVRGLITLLSTNSEYQQAVRLIADKKDKIVINDSIGYRFVLWAKHMRSPVPFQATIRNGWIGIYNAWEWYTHTGMNCTESWKLGAAMRKEVVSENEFIYHCNDGHPDDDFDDIVFKLTILEGMVK